MPVAELRGDSQRQEPRLVLFHTGNLVEEFQPAVVSRQVLAVLVEDIVVVDTQAKVDVHTKEALAAVARAAWAQIMYTEPVLLVEQ